MCDAVYASCPFPSQKWQGCLSSVLKRNLRYASAFVDGRQFGTADAMPSGDAEPIVFGFVGRIAREKNLSQILNHADTIKRLGCQLIIVGDGPERARFARANADFVGYKHGDDLIAMYRAQANASSRSAASRESRAGEEVRPSPWIRATCLVVNGAVR
jgi:glycosyltransferase involved in cell wall biosynthesis